MVTRLCSARGCGPLRLRPRLEKCQVEYEIHHGSVHFLNGLIQLQRSFPATVSAPPRMLITPRTYQQLQILKQQARKSGAHQDLPATCWRASPTSLRRAGEMLLVHQVGLVRVGEVVRYAPAVIKGLYRELIWYRYTLTYTPSLDRILPAPTHLHVKVKNTSAIPLRAAYLHGPYTLYTACYPTTFDPNHNDALRQDGNPDFEPNLKAGGSWVSRLTVPETIRDTVGKANVKRTTDGGIPKRTWIIEISSQVLFSTTATVHFELLIGRDESSIDLGFSGLKAQNIALPGQLQDHQQGKRGHDGRHATHNKGVFSKAVELQVDDTKSLWNKPALPEWADGEKDMKGEGSTQDPPSNNLHHVDHNADNEPQKKKQKRIHLVVLTHGLHSNIGADMLYMKESIDAAAKQAREDAGKRKAKQKNASPGRSNHQAEDANHVGGSSTAPLSGGQEELDPASEVESDDEEEVIVRGFSGNAIRTERGIQYLGKRLAKYVLEMTYPDQPFLPVKKTIKKRLSRVFTGQSPPDEHIGLPAHTHSSIHREIRSNKSLAYKITSISFIAHSLGGLTQTYAIAYIQKHSPQFFNEIKPINFVTMATPFLGLSNENPLYIKFALDFGLVGRTGQDLGLSWRAPAMVRSRWDAMIGGIGSEGQRVIRQPDPSSKPLLRILPTGPAHQVLKLFRNRTVYSNVVNDGIVPLRTSCLLFLDWSGLGRVEKARRENGIVGTMAGWGWAELTGANSSSHRHVREMHNDEVQSQASRSSIEGPRPSKNEVDQGTVPQPAEGPVRDDTSTTENESPEEHQFLEGHHPQEKDMNSSKSKDSPSTLTNPLSSLLNFLRPNPPKPRRPAKNSKIYKRSQTLNPDTGDTVSVSSGSTSGLDGSLSPRPGVVRGDSIVEDSGNVFTPPKTSILESAGDILNPPLPSRKFIINPASRPRTIFHDRIYHPEDIPPPLAKKRKALSRTFSSDNKNISQRSDTDYSNGKDPATTSGMKVEEKIARAYHHDVSWRKVLVRLEPDAHNNISVRRMFSNAYGWPVIKHLVDTHFSDSFAAKTADEKESNQERAKPMNEAVGDHGEEVDTAPPKIDISRTDSELREAKDRVSDLNFLQDSSMTSTTGRPRVSRVDSAQWDDALFNITDDDSESEDFDHHQRRMSIDEDGEPVKGTNDAEIADFLTASPPAEVDSVKTESFAEEGVLENGAKPLVLRGGTTSVGLGKSVHEQLADIMSVQKNPVAAKEAVGGGEGGESKDDDGNGKGPPEHLRDPLANLL